MEIFKELVYKGAPIVIPFVLGLFYYRELDKPLKYLFYFVALGTFNQIANYILIEAQLKNTLFLSHFYFLFTFLFLGLFYKELFIGFIHDKLIHLLMLLYACYWLINTLFLQSLFEYPGLSASIVKISFLLASIVFFYKTMLEATVTSLWKEPLIWINFAILIYYAGSVFYSILFNLVLDYSKEFSKLVGGYFGILNALFYILITVGMWLAVRRKTEV